VLIYGEKALAGKDRYTFHELLDLQSLRVEDVPDNESKKLQFAFQIACPKKSFVVYAESQAVKVEWMLAINEAATAWKANRATLRAGRGSGSAIGSSNNSVVVSNGSSEEAPVWTPDDEAKACQLCSAEFTFFQRRHHCRACGRVICGGCSEHKTLLPAMSKDPVRVCDHCFQKRAPEPSSPAVKDKEKDKEKEKEKDKDKDKDKDKEKEKRKERTQAASQSFVV